MGPSTGALCPDVSRYETGYPRHFWIGWLGINETGVFICSLVECGKRLSFFNSLKPTSRSSDDVNSVGKAVQF